MEAAAGVPQDYEEAVRWYRLAAAQGDATAQFNLGVRYAEGRGVVQDYVQAHKWTNLAASRQTGEERKMSADACDALAGLMTPEQIAEAQRLARAWDAAHPREPHCTPCPPAVGSASTPASSWSSEDSP